MADRLLHLRPRVAQPYAHHPASDDNVQAMRDRGIADACAGLPAFAWFDRGDLFASAPDGLPKRVTDDARYREAFAYARAYAAEVTP